MEAHGTAIDALYDRAKQAVRLETDRPHALRQAIQACRPGGTVSVPGVYGGLIDKFPIGAAFAKGLTFRMGQTHVPRYMKPLLERIARGEIDPSFLITHRFDLGQAAEAYRIFHAHEDRCVKCVLNPN
jgi:threonine dehydrogenase-like Zn-dependent dehydrogenase